MSAVKEDTDNGVRHAIEVRGLDNRFGTQQVHQDLDLDVRRGEILGVVGGSGTGKSVLLRSIVGLQKPHSGVVRIGGRDLLRAQWLARARMERRFGILFQKGALYSSLTVLENVALPLIEILCSWTSLLAAGLTHLQHRRTEVPAAFEDTPGDPGQLSGQDVEDGGAWVTAF